MKDNKEYSFDGESVASKTVQEVLESLLFSWTNNDVISIEDPFDKLDDHYLRLTKQVRTYISY